MTKSLEESVPIICMSCGVYLKLKSAFIKGKHHWHSVKYTIEEGMRRHKDRCRKQSLRTTLSCSLFFASFLSASFSVRIVTQVSLMSGLFSGAIQNTAKQSWKNAHFLLPSDGIIDLDAHPETASDTTLR